MSDVAAVVLAAGSGTRLRPLTRLRPKALCPVNNVPLVDLVLARVRTVTDDIAVNVHHHRALLEHHLAGTVHLSIEAPVALGTAGALGQLRDWIGGRPTLVVNADAWQDFELVPLLDGWDGERPRLFAVTEPHLGDFGDQRFAGASLLPWNEVARLDAAPSGLYETVWRRHWGAGTLELVPAPGRFIDCGTPGGYLDANLTASGGESVIGPGATVAGTVIRSVVWPGATVRRGERLVECIRAHTDITVPVRRDT